MRERGQSSTFPLERKNFEKQLQKIQQLVSSKLPTRILLITDADLIESLSDREFLPVALIPQHFPFSTNSGQTRASFAVSIMLVINKEPMWTDPSTGWLQRRATGMGKNSLSRFDHQPHDWLQILWTVVSSHPPRARALGKRSDSNIYQFLSLTPPRHENLREMVMKGGPVHTANLI